MNLPIRLDVVSVIIEGFFSAPLKSNFVRLCSRRTSKISMYECVDMSILTAKILTEGSTYVRKYVSIYSYLYLNVSLPFARITYVERTSICIVIHTLYVDKSKYYLHYIYCKLFFTFRRKERKKESVKRRAVLPIHAFSGSV